MLLEAPDGHHCRSCYAPIRWVWHHTRGCWIALEPKPVANGAIYIMSKGAAIDVPACDFEDTRHERWRAHAPNCGLRGLTSMPGGLERLSRGDDRGTRKVRKPGAEPNAWVRPNGKCEACGRSIRWVSTRDGRKVPVDSWATNSGGLVFVDQRQTLVEPALDQDEADFRPRYRNHHSRCQVEPPPPDQLQRTTVGWAT